jgi:hypothetical protein
VCIAARAVERYDQSLHPGGSELANDRCRDARARGAQSEILGPELDEVMQHRGEVGAAKRVAAAD